MPSSDQPPPSDPPSGDRGITAGRPVTSAIYLWFFLAILGIAGIANFAVPAISRFLPPSEAKVRSERSLLQARRIYNACQAFAAVRGKLPATLEDLVPDFLPDRRELSDPGHPEAGEIGYFYYAGGAAPGEPASVFLAGKAETRGRRVIVRFDGKAREELYPESRLRE